MSEGQSASGGADVRARRHAAILAALREGKTGMAVATAFGVSQKTVYAIARAGNVALRRGRRRAPVERVEFIQRHLRAGYSLAEIGGMLGVSRARVQQIAAEAGRTDPLDGPRQDDPVRILRAARAASGVTAACREAGVSRRVLYRVLEGLGVRPAVERLWRWRRAAATRTRAAQEGAVLVAALHRMAAIVGREPHTTDFRGQHAGAPSITRFYAHFGSFNDALAAAGFTRHGPGGRRVDALVGREE